jgi:hypothetical protein
MFFISFFIFYMSIGITDTLHETDMQQENVATQTSAETCAPLSSIRLIMSDQDLAFQQWLIQHEAQMNTGIRHDHAIRRSY